MNSLTVNSYYKIDDLIEIVKNKEDRDSIYMVYVPDGTDDLSVGMQVYVGDVPDFDEDDNEVFPDFVGNNGLEVGYRRDQFQDVIDLAYRQKPTASIDEVVECLNHYAEYDDFLDLS
ncbi:DUF7716 domain-containing protein [Burkholderia plantarii]|uniref:DUF7716 domain-containing protein n=1 Tax=Burkholderia plantarii TaxID=41899 RepID=UPI0007065325|nr:hypothetical protein [Burkholderia plantarii]ALK30272.1 hypothetical protein bpln_1g14590 [Burkholderia plantarii]GLZ18382.1 hypothetical protein Bpla01_19120 [Burkholderia plantarii]